MTLLDIAPLETWIELEKDIHKRFGLDVNVFDIKGYRISDFKSWANRLCPQIKATDKGQSFICAPAHMNLAAQAMQTRQAVIEECDAGLAKIVIPIFVENEFVGAVGACGYLLDDGEVDSFLVNKMTDIDEDTVQELSVDIPTITTDGAKNLVVYIQKQIDILLRASHDQK